MNAAPTYLVLVVVAELGMGSQTRLQRRFRSNTSIESWPAPARTAYTCLMAMLQWQTETLAALLCRLLSSRPPPRKQCLARCQLHFEIDVAMGH